MDITKSLFAKQDSGLPFFMEEQYPLDWSMTRSEKFCFIKLLEKIKPQVAIEIGIDKGGSLQVLSENAEKVYAIDIDETAVTRLKNKFDNVEFLIGDSKVILPQLLKKIQAENKSLEFALIDGNHTEEGVRADIKNLIKYVPKKSLNILLHDSFNPNCRKGMQSVNYSKNKHIHYVELDYISGTFNPDGQKNEMWGGFAHIVLLNEQRNSDLNVYESQKKLFKITYLYSKHYLKNTFRFLKPLKKILKG